MPIFMPMEGHPSAHGHTAKAAAAEWHRVAKHRVFALLRGAHLSAKDHCAGFQARAYPAVNFEQAGYCETPEEAISFMLDSIYPQPGHMKNAVKEILGIGDIEEWSRKYLSFARAVYQTRISPYTAVSFKPPSYGINASQEKIPSSGQRATAGSKITTNTSAATLVLVSTLQDDIQYSMQLLYHMANVTSTGGMFDGLKSFPLFNESLIDTQIISRAQHNLVVTEISADKYPQVKPQKYKTSAGESAVQNVLPKYPGYEDQTMFGPVEIGQHILKNPLVSSVTTEQFSYEGAELLKTTLELIPSGGELDFYSYEIPAGAAERNISPRAHKTYSYGPGSQGANAKFNRKLKEAYARYPLYFQKSMIGNLNPTTGEPFEPKLENTSELGAVMAKKKASSRSTLNARLAIINGAVQSGNKAAINALVSNTAFPTMGEAEIIAETAAIDAELEALGPQTMTPAERRAARRDANLRGPEHAEERRRLGPRAVRDLRRQNREANRDTRDIQDALAGRPYRDRSERPGPGIPPLLGGEQDLGALGGDRRPGRHPSGHPVDPVMPIDPTGAFGGYSGSPADVKALKPLQRPDMEPQGHTTIPDPCPWYGEGGPGRENCDD